MPEARLQRTREAYLTPIDPSDDLSGAMTPRDYAKYLAVLDDIETIYRRQIGVALPTDDIGGNAL